MNVSSVVFPPVPFPQAGISLASCPENKHHLVMALSLTLHTHYGNDVTVTVLHAALFRGRWLGHQFGTAIAADE